MGTFATTSSLAVKMIGTVFDTATTNLASACMFDAENEIQKRLAKRYDFTASPFLTTTTHPPMIVTLVQTLSIGYMYENMARGSKEGLARADRYLKRVFENIDGLLDGKFQLSDASGTLVTETEGEWKVYESASSYEPTFNEDSPESWSVDSDKLDDIASDRE